MTYQFDYKTAPIPAMKGYILSNRKRTPDWDEDLQLLAPSKEIYSIKYIAWENITVEVSNGPFTLSTKKAEWILKRETGDLSFPHPVAIVEYLENQNS